MTSSYLVADDAPEAVDSEVGDDSDRGADVSSADVSVDADVALCDVTCGVVLSSDVDETDSDEFGGD